MRKVRTASCLLCCADSVLDRFISRKPTEASAELLPDAPSAHLIAQATSRRHAVAQSRQRSASCVNFQLGQSSAADAPAGRTDGDQEQPAESVSPPACAGPASGCARNQIGGIADSGRQRDRRGRGRRKPHLGGIDSLPRACLSMPAPARISASSSPTSEEPATCLGSSKLQEKAQNASALATEKTSLLPPTRPSTTALQAQALYQVAKQNVDTRQTTDTQIGELTKNKLKSTLDLSFADVNLSQAKLLLLDAQNQLDSTMAALDAVLGLDREVQYELVDDTSAAAASARHADQLVATRVSQQRPDLQALNFESASSRAISAMRSAIRCCRASALRERWAACPSARRSTTRRTGGAELAST